MKRNPLAPLTPYLNTGEAALSMLTGAAAEPIAGLAGIWGLRNGYQNAASNVEQAREMLTYRPRDPSALEALGRAVAPVTSRYEAAKQWLGDTAQDHGAGPGLATAAYMVPDTLLSLVGARNLPKGGPTMGEMAQNAMAPRQLHPQRGVIGVRPEPEPWGAPTQKIDVEGGQVWAKPWGIGAGHYGPPEEYGRAVKREVFLNGPGGQGRLGRALVYYDDNNGYGLSDIHVEDRARRQGHGSRLMDALFQTMPEADQIKILTGLSGDGRALMERYGLQETGGGQVVPRPDRLR